MSPVAAVDALKSRLRGSLVRRDDEAYDASRRIWNRAIDRKPLLMVRCAGPSDVAECVRFAQEHGLEIAIRGGGHHAAGHAVCDDGIVIDVSPMKGVTIDTGLRRAIAQTGLTWAGFDHETQAWGLATTGPIVSMTGLPGFTLGGGIGWLQRKFGLACDNLVSAHIVTADGSMLRAADDEHPDLLWALRGGGGNFGVITSLEFELHALGPDVLAGLVYFPIGQIDAVAAGIDALAEIAPDALTACLFLRRAPPVPAVPAGHHGAPVVAVALCWCDSIDAGEAWVSRVRGWGTPLADTVRVMRYLEWQRSLDSRWGDGFYNDWTGHFIDDPRRCAGVLAAAIEALRSPWSDIKIFMLGGAVARVDDHATAFGCRRARFALVIQARWEDPAATQDSLRWARGTLSALAPHAAGSVYANFLAADEGDRVPSAFGAANYRRLRAVKRQYDPGNVFHCNANIPPATSPD